MKALAFVKKYYEVLDSREPGGRESLLMFYNDAMATAGTPLMQWNGHACATVSDIAAYLQNLPKTKHELRSVDAQALPGSQSADSFMITVNGSCMYDDEHLRYFYERLIIARDGATHYIANTYYRWTGEVIK